MPRGVCGRAAGCANCAIAVDCSMRPKAVDCGDCRLWLCRERSSFSSCTTMSIWCLASPAPLFVCLSLPQRTAPCSLGLQRLSHHPRLSGAQVAKSESGGQSGEVLISDNIRLCKPPLPALYIYCCASLPKRCTPAGGRFIAWCVASSECLPNRKHGLGAKTSDSTCLCTVSCPGSTIMPHTSRGRSPGPE